MRASEISASTTGGGAGGNIAITGKELLIDGQGLPAKIASETASETTAKGGSVRVDVSGEVTLKQGGLISTKTSGQGNAGETAITSGSLTIDGGGMTGSFFTGLDTSQDSPTGAGNAGRVLSDVREGIVVRNGGEIRSSTLGTGNGGSIDIQAGTLLVDGQGLLARISSQSLGPGDGGGIDIQTEGDVSVVNRGKIFSSTLGSGAAGAISIDAKSIRVQGPETETGISSLASFGSSGRVGAMSISARERLTVMDGASISVENHAILPEPSANSTTSLNVLAPEISVMQSARISTETSGNIPAATLRVSPTNGGETLVIRGDGTGEITSSTRLPTITDIQYGGVFPESGSANAGNVEIRASGVTLQNAVITSQSKDGTSGQAGQVQIIADETLSILNHSRVTTDTAAGGNAGNVLIRARSLFMDSAQVSSNSREGANGNAGDVVIDVEGSLTLENGAAITSASRSVSGAAGTVALTASGEIQLTTNSRIATDTSGAGDAGSIKLFGGNLSVARSEISSGTLVGSSGDGGNIDIVLTDRFSLTNGGAISTSTLGSSRAGTVNVRAGDIDVRGLGSGIKAIAGPDSSGNTGDINLVADRAIFLGDQTTLSIQNDATQSTLGFNALRFGARDTSELLPGSLSLSAPQIVVEGARVNASATGNFAASQLQVRASDGLTLRNASLTTTAQNGNGGGICIRGGQFFRMERSQIATSVLGTQSGNGGDIDLQADTLFMDTGFVQANTTAPQATGGNINVDVGLLVSTGILLLGGDQPLTFDPSLIGVNVIQAASPDGVSGNISVSGPIIDTTGKLRLLSAAPSENPAIERDLCRRSAGSTFTSVGRGGLRLRSNSWVRAEKHDVNIASGMASSDKLNLTECLLSHQVQ